jgi:hypothetical protein
MENSQIKNTVAYELYCLDRQYKSAVGTTDWSTNLEAMVSQAQDFYNGKQYPKGNANNAIRVTLNICSFAATIKASKVCGTPIYIAYTADDPDVDCGKLRQFDEYNQSKLRQKTFNFQAALNGFVNGTEITFVRWDDDDTSYKGIYKGGLVYEHIDPRNFAVANNRLPDIQNQAWVMFWCHMEVSAIEEMLEAKSDKEKNEKLEAIRREVDPSGGKDSAALSRSLVRVYTRYFRVDGEVYFECATQTVDIFAYPKPLNRRLHKAKIKKIIDEFRAKQDEAPANGENVKDYAIDYEDAVMQKYDSTVLSDEEYKGIKEKFSLYPFASFAPFAINGSFWGRSDITSLIPTQKAINFMLSMTLKCAENNAYNKIFAKADALQGQVITNEPSQIIYDYSGFTNSWGIKMAETPPVPNGLTDFTDRLLAMTRIVCGFNDVMDGSVTNKDMSGYMLQQMIKQSNTSIEQQQQIFWEFNEKLAEIRLMFYKHYVDKARYTAALPEAEYDENEEARQMLYNAALKGRKFETMPGAKPEDFAKQSKRVKVEEILGDELYGVNIDIAVEAMQGLADSKLIEQQMFDNLFLNGGIQNVEPQWLQAYFECSPNVSPRTKAAIRGIIEREKRSRIAQLEDQLKEVVGKTQQIIAYAQQLENTVGVQGSYLKNLTAEFTGKIAMQNKVIGGLQKDLMQYREPQSEGEKKSANATGKTAGDANGNPAQS